jgi:hypothetical protein
MTDLNPQSMAPPPIDQQNDIAGTPLAQAASRSGVVFSAG